jgi:cyclopropane fatty-acyl-phospholipid synthase-like methyltransferase
MAYHLAFTPRRVHSAAYWDRRLEESWDAPSRDWPERNRLIERLTGPDQHILDIGCGNGGLLRYLKSRGYTQLRGLEHSAYACRRLAEAGIAMTLGSLHDISPVGEQFDVVIASQVLEHVIRRNRFMRQIKAALRAEGRVLVFVPDNCLNPLEEPEHVAVYTKASLARFLNRHFDKVEVSAIVERDAPNLFAQMRGPKLRT